MQTTIQTDENTHTEAHQRVEHLTFEQMQSLALEIDRLLDAAMATYGTEDANDHLSLIEMAQNRADRPNRALDPVYVSKAVAETTATDVS